jgi:hypothetical protein
MAMGQCNECGEVWPDGKPTCPCGVAAGLTAPQSCDHRWPSMSPRDEDRCQKCNMTHIQHAMFEVA